MANVRPDLPFSNVLDHFVSTEGAVVDEAARSFMELVDPQIEAGDERAAASFEAAFAEWFVFDRRLEDGRTPLESYLELAPAREDERTLDALRQAAESQVCGTFVVTGTISGFSLLTLESLLTGERYPVFDENVCAAVPQSGGIMGARLVRVDGRWYFAGVPVFFAPIEPMEELLDGLREETGDRERFVDLVRRTYGPRDELQFQVSTDYGMSAEERQERLTETERSYRALRDRNPGLPAWEDVRQAIVHDAAASNPNAAMLALFADEDGTVDLDSDESLRLLLASFFDAWNLLPHDSLGGKTPIETAEASGV